MVEFIKTTTFSVAVISTSGSWALRQAQEPPVEGLNERCTHYFWDSPFEEAKTVFYDPNAKLIADPDHSEEEDRFIILGISNNSEVLAVCHCYRENDEVIRIISARKATTNEKKQYGEN